MKASPNKSAVKFLIPIFVVAGFLAVVGIYGFVKDQNKGVDILSESGQVLPLQIKPLGRIIIHQDGSLGQPNPPVNLNWNHLLVKGDFEVTATMTKIDKQASFRLYSSPPIIYDQWRQETPSIDVNINLEKNLVTAKIWDGSSSDSLDMRIYEIKLTPTVAVSLEHSKNKINIIVNNKLLGDMPDHNIFDAGTIWFGTDATTNSSGWTLSSLTAKTTGTGSVKIAGTPSLVVSQDDKNSLRSLADANSRKIKIGAAVAIEPLLTDPKYRELALGQFNMITPENSMKPQFIHPMQNVYDFSRADLLVDIALKNNITVHGHALIYDKSTPDWMTNIPINQRQEIMTSHIKNVVGHFKGKIAEWDVVNEILSNKNALYKNNGTGLKPNIWFEALGEKYIDLAFATAHKADPSARLYLNDYGLENDGQRWDALLNLVKRLKERNVPIDGIGFQAHIYGDGDYINKDQLKKHMEILNELRLLTRISEIDVVAEDPQEQVNQYSMVLDVCLKKPNCTSYTTWGITDLYGSTTKSDRYPLVLGNSLLWDKNMNPKPAFFAIQEKLKQ